jgi:virginiamycin B lyase
VFQPWWKKLVIPSKLGVYRLAAALTVGVALLTLATTPTSAGAHARVTGTPAVGDIECTFSATLKFHTPLTNHSDSTGKTVAAGTVSGCSSSWNFCCSTTGTASPISGGVFRAGYGSSPINCATLSTTSAPLFGDTEIEWLAYGKRWQPSNVVGGLTYGSFPGGATVTYNIPSGLAAQCAARRGIRKLSVTGALTLGPSCSSGTPPFTIYPIGGGTCGAGAGSAGIAAGSDGAIWFTVSPPCVTCAGYVGRITTAGAMTLYPVTGADPISITAGPDGALWFTDQANVYQVSATQQTILGGSIGRITTAGVVTLYPVSGAPADITTGPDGALWFADGNNSIDRITTSGTVTTYTDPGITSAGSLTAGPDGALWFINNGHWVNIGKKDATFIKGSIGRITTAGVVSSYGAGSINASAITSGPDGALWFAEGTYQGNAIGRITTSGTITTYTDPNICSPYAITTGPDGALWFTNYDCPSTPQGSQYSGSIGRLTTSGQVTVYTSPGLYVPYAITTGSDGAMWFVSRGNGAIGRLAIS